MDINSREKIEEAICKVYDQKQAQELLDALPKVAYHNGRMILREVQNKWDNEMFYEIFPYIHSKVWDSVKTLVKEICDADTLSRIHGEERILYAQNLAEEICQFIYEKKKNYNIEHGDYHYTKDGHVKECGR